MIKILAFLSSGFHVFFALKSYNDSLKVTIVFGIWFLVLFLAQFIVMNELNVFFFFFFFSILCV